MNVETREKFKLAVENALKERQDNLYDILYMVYSTYLSDKKENSIAKKAITGVVKGLNDIQNNIINNGILHKRADDTWVKGYWKYVKEADTADKLIVPFIETLYPGLHLTNQRSDGTYVYDSMISGSSLDLLLEYKKVGYYCGDCFSINDLKNLMLSNNLLNKNNTAYLRAGLRNQAVSYLAKSADSTSGWGMIVATNGIWYTILLTGISNYSDTECTTLEALLGSKLNGSNCDFLRNCGIPIMQFSIFDEDAIKKTILFRHFVNDYLNYSSTFVDIMIKLRDCFITSVQNNLV